MQRTALATNRFVVAAGALSVSLNAGPLLWVSTIALLNRVARVRKQPNAVARRHMSGKWLSADEQLSSLHPGREDYRDLPLDGSGTSQHWK